MAYVSAGVRVASPTAFMAAAGTSLHAAEHQMRADPRVCGPGPLPGLLAEAQRILALLVSVMTCLSAADLDRSRRDGLTEATSQLRVALARLATAREPTPGNGTPRT